MRKIKLFLTLLMLICIGVTQMWAEEKVSTLTFTAAASGSGTADDAVDWTVTSDGIESTYDATKGIHYGTGSAQVTYIQLATSGISGTITKVVVNASTASGVTASASVTVGGSAFGGDPKSLSATATNYTFDGSASGEIVVRVTKPSKATKAIYVKSVAVTYTTGGDDPTPPTPTLSSIEVATAPTTLTYTEGDVFDPTGLVITRTFSSGDPDTYVYAGHTEEFTFEPSLSTALTTSDASVTITYGGKSTTQNITVNAASSGDEPGGGDESNDGLINFGSADGSTNISGTSVTGDDSRGQTWTITTAGTTSFTPSAEYAQIGSSKKTATSITFTTTLNQAMTVSAFSAKFGGFSGTAGTVTLKVDDTTVGSGSLDGTTDVTINASNTTTSGTVLTVTVTGIDKGVKAYYISYTVASTGGGDEPVSPKPVITFSPQEGSFCEAQNVTLSSSVEGATIYYSIDDADPSTLYTGVIAVSETTTIKAYATKDNTDGDVASATFTITAKEDPTITPTDGNVEVGKTLDVSTLFSSNSVGAITYSITAGDAATIEGNTLSAVKAGSVTVQASQEANGCYNAKTATATVTVTAPLPKITITQAEIADFTNTYAQYDWTANGVSGKTYAYKNAGIQLNSDKDGHYVYNTTPVPGNITKITMTKASGTDRSWTPYVSASAMTSATGTALKAQTVGTSGTTWDVTGSNQYFYLDISGGSTVISSIVITYEPIISAVTVDGEIAHGSVAVSGAEDMTAVAAGTELTLTAFPVSDEYQLKDYNVFKTGDAITKIAVSNSKFIMPLYDVTVSAEFEEAKELDHLVITNEASQKTFWVGEDFNYDGLAIKAVYDNETEKENVEPKSISTPDMNEAGPKTVTIAYEEKGIEKTISYEITVKALPTDPTKPCTVVEALDYLDKFDDLEDAYVTGKVSEITEEFSSYGNISYNISDDGETSSPQLLVYRGKDFDGENFPNAEAILVGDSVVVTGKIFTYEKTNTKEFAQNNQIFYRPKKVVSIALSEGYKTAFNDDEAFSHEGVVVTATYNYGDDETVNATWSEPVMTQLGEQEVTVSYTYEGKTVEFKYTITITHVCAPENLVAVTKGEEDNTKGTYTVVEENVCTEGDGATVDVTDIVPAEGYRFKEITATAGDVDNNLKKVTGIKAATTITVVFEQIPSYDVTWNVNGETSTTKVQEGSKPIFPTPNPESCDATSTAFYGWATAPWTGKAENLNEKTVYTSAADMPEVMAAGTIYYAVFAKATEVPGEEHTLTLVESDFGLTTNYAEHTATKSGIGFTVNQGYKGSGNVIQMNSSKGTGSLYNTTAIAGLKSVTVNVASGEKTYDITTGTEQNPTANKQQSSATGTFNAVAGDTYFQLKVSGASYFSSIVVTYAEVAYEYSEFLTTCCTKYDITIDSEIEHGSVSADLAKACEGATVTLTPAADPAYHFDAWSVSYNDGENDHPVTVTENKFTMPAFDVTVSATFEHDECTQLGTPVNVEAVADYKSAILDWDDVENADHYVVTIKKGSETVESNTVDVSEYVVGVTLLTNTTYTYEIQATANDALTHCPSALASADFETEPLPTAHLILSENGVEHEFEKDQHKLNDIVALPSAEDCSKTFVGWSANAECAVAPDTVEGTQYQLKNTTQTLYAVYATAGAGQAMTLFEETFSSCNTTGGNDGSWSGSIANGALDADYNGWTLVKQYAAKECAKFATGNDPGSAQTPTITINGSATLTFRAGAWSSSSESTTLKISAIGATLDRSSVTLAKGSFTSYTVAITGANGDVKIKFESNANKNSRFFLDDVVVSQNEISYSDYSTTCAALLEAPEFSLAEQEDPFTSKQTVELTADEGTIYYTLDGTTPTSESTEYNGAIVLNTCGTHTIKAIAISTTSYSLIASATYTLAIPLPENSKANPYTPEQAIAAITSNCYNGTDSIAVKGVVKTASSLNTNYGNYDNIVVVAEETTEPEFTFYRMYKGANNAQFDTNDPAIAGGDTIVAYGILTKHNDTYQLAQGCYLISRKEMKQAKLHIESSLENPISIANAINYVDNGATYDLSEEVYVKGVANAAPNSYGTFTAHDANVENSFQFYDANLNELTIVANDTVIVKGLITLVGTNYRMTGGVVQQVTAYKEHKISTNPAEVAFDEVEQNATSVDAIDLNVYLTNVESATVTLTDENNVFGINQTKLTENGVVVVSVTNTNVEVGPYAATITIHDEAGVAADKVVNVTMTITADPRKKAQDLDGFEALNGNLNADIAFASTKGDGTSDPILSDGKILYYQPGSGKAAGGYMTLTAVKGCTIDQVKVVTANHDTKIKYSKDGEELSDATDVNAGATYLTPAELNAQTVNIYCAGADKNYRLYVAQVVVYYTGEATPLDHYSVVADNVATTEFPKNGTFSSEGLVVYACYDANCEDKVDITDQCNVVADLTSTGEKKAEVYLGENKLGEYDINVIAGQDDPALAYTPDEETIPAAGIGGWVAPTLNNPFNVTPDYSTSNEAVATVSEDGIIALAGGYGKAVITASFAETEDYIASVATYTITVQEPANKIAGKWMVAGAEDIKPGIKVIVVGEKSGTKYAMGAQNTNNRAAVAAQSIVNDTLYAAEGTKTFTLVDAGDGKYAFLANNGMYLYAASGSSNHLKEQATINGNATWSIAIANDGKATIQAQGTNSRNLMSMTPNGNNNPLFSCYKDEQSAIKLYVNRNQIDGSDDPANPAEVAINDNVLEDEIVANGNVVVTVNTDNIEEPKSYIAQNGATIIITGTNPVAKNVVVEDGSRIEASVPTTTPNVYFATTMGSTQVPGTASELGSVTNITLATGGEIIYDLTLGTSMAGIQADPNQWHAFTLPFAVSATEGIYDAETGAKLYNEVNYAIMDYHGDIRANGLYGWKKYSGILQPGVFYIMTVDGNTKTFRFKATQTGPMTQTTSKNVTAYNGSGESSDYGWNGIGNPSWVSGTVEVNVQVLDPYTYTYQTLTSGTNITVSTPFFYNAGGSGAESTIEMQDAGAGANYAPVRTPANEIKNVAVTFGNEVFRDKIYISASEDALNEYEQDKDLVRMIMSNTPKVAQIFGNAYGMKLSMVNAPMANDQAEYSLTLYAPNAGEYTISAPEMEDADIFLTYEGSIIWNLSMSDYTNDFAKGNNEGYGLILVKKAPQVITGVDNAETNEAGVQKVIINDHVYILRAEQMYDVTGKMVK